MNENFRVQFKGKNCLVTGGAGFIGSNLSRYLNKIGARVTIIDNFSTGRKDNIFGFNDLGINVVNADVTDQNNTQKFYENIDFVFHQAAIASVPLSIEDPVLTQHHNVDGTVSALENSYRCGVEKFIFASSSAVYGDTSSVPTKESIEPMPQSPYAEHKLASEEHCHNYYKSNRLRTTSLRYFNVFGPYQDPSSEYSAVIPKFINLALNNKDLIIYGDGNSTRDFVFVEDVIQANLRVAISEKSDGEVINIAHGKTINVGDLADMIIEITDSQSSIVYEAPRKGDIVHSAADLTKAKRLISCEPLIDLKDGLSKTIDYFKQL